MSDGKWQVRRVAAEEYATALRGIEQSAEAPVSFLQSPLYGRLQEKDGKAVVYFVAAQADATVACGLAVKYTAPLGMSFLYCPYGPAAQAWSTGLMAAFRDFFRPVARELGCAFVRLDAATDDFASVVRPISNRLAKTASLQPRAEWMLDIGPDENDLWMAFHKHARYNIRLAERARAETTVYKPAEAPLDDFFGLMQTTGGRDSFGIFDKSYYESYLSAMSEDEGFMVVCRIDGVPVAAALFVTYDGQAHYVFAGSSDDYRKIAPAYTVIWTALQEARRRGCTLFNFGGIVDDVKGHDLAGVTAFKRRFGGYELRHPNPTDIVVKPLLYFAFTVYKHLR